VRNLVLIACGGAIGAMLRYGVDQALTRRFGPDFPWGTFTINVVGAFALGLLLALTIDRSVLPHLLVPALGIGMLGAFTTFSTYAADVVSLAERGAASRALVYVVATNMLGLAAGWGGFLAGRRV
jgi:CrcB protein